MTANFYFTPEPKKYRVYNTDVTPPMLEYGDTNNVEFVKKTVHMDKMWETGVDGSGKEIYMGDIIETIHATSVVNKNSSWELLKDEKGYEIHNRKRIQNREYRHHRQPPTSP